MVGRDETLEHQSFGLSGRALCLALFGKYTALAAYGVWAAIVELPTFTIVASAGFAVWWATTVAVLATVAALGVARTWGTGRFRLEKWTTALFIVVFSGYSYALIYRSAVTENWDSAPLALIPVVVCILPAIRWFSLVVHGRDLRFTRRGVRR